MQEQLQLIAFFRICNQSADKENSSEIHAESVIARTVGYRVSIAFIRKSYRVKRSSSEGAFTGRIFFAYRIKGVGNTIGYPFVFRIKKQPSPSSVMAYAAPFDKSSSCFLLCSALHSSFFTSAANDIRIAPFKVKSVHIYPLSVDYRYFLSLFTSL